MKKDSEYTAKDIVSLTDREHVRLRTQIYLGNMNPMTYCIPLLSESELKTEYVTFIPAVYKAIGEIIDNSLDEFSQLTTKNKTLTIQYNETTKSYTIQDNGRGIPIEKKTELVGKTNREIWTPELAIARLRAGRNFTDEKLIGVQGMNGVGAACTNFCSSHFNVTVTRDKKIYKQTFTNGAEKTIKPIIEPTTAKTCGTQIGFTLDDKVFSNTALPYKLIRNRAIEIALTNPDVKVIFNDETFQYKKGLQEYINTIKSDNYIIHRFDINEENIQGEIYVICDNNGELDEQMFTWVNSSLLFDGGKCNTQFFNALFDKVSTHLEKEAKKLKAVVTRNDIRQGLIVLANLKIKNPEFDSQSKLRLTGPDFRKEFVNLIDTNWKAFAKSTSSWMENVLERANERHHAKENKKAIDDHEKGQKKKIIVPGLLDATGTNRAKCNILITEGLSAKNQISEARDPETTGAFALTGKINNTWDCTPAQVLQMGKLKDLLTVVGLIPGKKAIRSQLNYGKIIPATDADSDGSDIFTLLVCLFFKFWPELFDPKQPPVIYRLITPNIIATKGAQRVYFTTKSEYEKVKDKYKGWTVDYLKGLGRMSKEDWKRVLSSDEFLIPIIDDGNLQNTFELLFGDDADLRKDWLSIK